MDSESEIFLQNYLKSLSADERKRYHKFDSYHFCADEKNANTCARLVLDGEKRATAGLVWSYEEEGEPFPEIGQLTVITDWDKIPQCVIETTSVEIRPFHEVDAEFAFEEGEGDKSLDYWKKVHWEFFRNECRELGKEPSEKMPVILEKFKVVYKAHEI